MYTKCPECNSVFEITATDLAVAGGFVRCGQCAVSFDALNSLSDNSAALDAGGPEPGSQTSAKLQADDTASANETAEHGDVEVLSPDTDSDSAGIAEETPDAVPPDPAGDLGEEIVETIEPDTVEADTESIEPDSSGTELSSADKDLAKADGAEQLDEDNLAPVAETADIDDDEILLDDSYEPPLIDDDEEFYDDDDDDTLIASASEFQLFMDSENDEADTAGEAETAAEADGQADESALFALPLPELTALEHTEHGTLPEKLEGGEALHTASAQSPAQKTSRSQQPTSDGTTARKTTSTWLRDNDAYDAEDARDLKDYLRSPGNRTVNAAWIGGTVLMALLLAVQVIHRYRGDLVIHPRIGPVIQTLYKVVGVDLRPNWKVDEYKVVGQARLFLMPLDEEENDDGSAAVDAGAGDPDATAIRFVAIISNGARLPQPAPLVRLTLRDRWGDPTGARTFAPPEYLADRTMIDQLLEPGQRLRVVLNLYDFGSDAVGFDFDMCLPDDRGDLRCAHEG